MHSSSDLDFHLAILSQRVGRANTVTIHHAAELRAFEGLTPAELSAAAARHDLRIVRRMGGTQLEFTHDAKD